MRSVDFADDCAEFLSGAQFQIPYPQPMRDEKCAGQKKPCARPGGIFDDSLGEHQTDDDRLAILRSQEFALTANRVHGDDQDWPVEMTPGPGDWRRGRQPSARVTHATTTASTPSSRMRCPRWTTSRNSSTAQRPRYRYEHGRRTERQFQGAGTHRDLP